LRVPDRSDGWRRSCQPNRSTPEPEPATSSLRKVTRDPSLGGPPVAPCPRHHPLAALPSSEARRAVQMLGASVDCLLAGWPSASPPPVRPVSPMSAALGFAPASRTR
jgi:hypothetical protein